MKRLAAIIITMLALSVAAQDDFATDLWMYDGGSEADAADMHDRLSELKTDPVNLNDTSSLGTLPLMTPFRILALKNYIKLHGYLLSTKELAFVPGFDSATIGLLAPMVKTEPPTGDRRWWLQRGRHSIVSGIGGTVEKAMGYTDGSYSGDNLHSLFCYTYKVQNHLDIRFAADKDPAEPWGRHNFYGYHAMLGDIGRIERLAVGRYSLQFGQGLTLWTGLRPFDIIGTPPVRFGSGVRAAGIFNETDYQEGVAATVHLIGRVFASGFASSARGKRLAGGHAEWRGDHFNIGTTLTYTSISDSLVPTHRTYNANAFFGTRLFNAGIDAQAVYGSTTLYTEAAIGGDNGAIAATAGIVVNASDNAHFGISLRHCSPHYHNLNAQPYAIGSAQGQQGLRIDATAGLPLQLLLATSMDIHRNATLRYADYHPSSGVSGRIQVERPIGRHAKAIARYTYRRQERNIPNLDSALYRGEQTQRHLLQAEVKATAGCWQLSARTTATLFSAESHEVQRGWLVAATARYTRSAWQATAGVAYFDVDGYNARIYLSESNIQYVWSMPMLYGRGWRGHLLLRANLSRHLSLAAKYALSAYPGQQSVGTGHAQTDGPLRQTWHVQLKVKL